MIAVVTEHRFDTAIALQPRSNNPLELHGETSENYWNMVGPFGGTTAATMLNAVLQQPDLLGTPIALTVNYAGPLEPGEFHIDVRCERTNRSNQHWSIVQRQGDAVTTTATAVTAARKDTWTDTEAQIPAAEGPDSYTPFGPIPGINWSGSYDIRYVEGELPTIEGKEESTSRTSAWIRDEPPRPLDFTALASMADGFYPRPFLRHGRYLPAGTVSLSIHFLADADDLADVGTDHILGTAYPRRFARSYYDQTSELWSARGQLLAAAHQIVYYKV